MHRQNIKTFKHAAQCNENNQEPNKERVAKNSKHKSTEDHQRIMDIAKERNFDMKVLFEDDICEENMLFDGKTIV